MYKTGATLRRTFSLIALTGFAALSACVAERAGTPTSVEAPATERGGIAMAVTKAADAANVCYIEPTEELRARLSPEQFAVLVESGTEPPFRNAYWDNHEPGVYVDAVDGVPLFASLEKFDSGTGWPSFWSPIDPARISLVEDLSYGMRRVEVRAKASGGHLGHLFEDGPQPTGLRYCINSASLRFIPRAALADEGYAELEALFQPR